MSAIVPVISECTFEKSLGLLLHFVAERHTKFYAFAITEKISDKIYAEFIFNF
ncbi:hypothetical protein D3C83_328380 [compost metagenome]